MSLFPEARILEVDLSQGSMKTRIISGETYRLYPGGSALGLYLTVGEIPVATDALSAGNLLAFTVSPLTGLPISGISRLCVTAKSPLTGAMGDSQAGGFIASHLKNSGWDGILFRGKAPDPVYLYINGSEVSIRSAKGMWGKITGESEDLIRQDLGVDDVEIAQIGPAGERLVRYGAIINRCSRANGRTGMGAVMGSKNLKAVVVRKVKGHKPAHPEGFSNLAKSAVKRLSENDAVAGLAQYGTDGDLIGFSEEGFLPTRNWNSGHFPEGAENITGTTMSTTVLKSRDTCFACAVRCKRVVEIPGIVDPLYGGPEYETCATFGSYCGVTDMETVCLANQLCNMHGMDTISCGATVSFAMECFEKGLISEKDTGGIQLTFGNGSALIRMIKQIAAREGLGNLLAEGSARAAAEIGGGAKEFSISVKGLELPAHMPQYKPAVGLIYAVNPFGADHQSSEHDVFLMMPPDSRERQRLGQLGIWKGYDNPYELDSEKVRFAFESQKFFSMLDTLCLCQFVWGPSWELYGPSDIVELCKTGIGWETSLQELMLVGERRIAMMRWFNWREGFTAEADKLPKRLFQPFLDGPSAGVALDRDAFEKAKVSYYRLAGWDLDSGELLPGTLERLSLNWLT